MEAAREIAGMVANSNNKLMLDSDALLLDREVALVHPFCTLADPSFASTVNDTDSPKK